MFKPTWKIWFEKAAEDLKVARFILPQARIDESFLGPLVFHSQQVAEKAIKGYLTFNKRRFGKTHDIGELLKIVRTVDADFAEALWPAETLTDYAVAYRYPEEGKLQMRLTAELGEIALNLAHWIYEETKSRVID